MITGISMCSKYIHTLLKYISFLLWQSEETQHWGTTQVQGQCSSHGECQANRGYTVRHCLRTNEKGWYVAQSVECRLAGPRSWF